MKVNGKVSALLELGAGFNPEFTGRQNVYMNGALIGFNKDEMDERFDAIAEFADIGEFIDQPVKTYSSGMYVRLAFAAAINVDPEILLWMRRCVSATCSFRSKCMKKMKQLMGHGCTTLFVSHDTAAVRSLCSRAVYLDSGGVRVHRRQRRYLRSLPRDQRERSGFFRQAGNEKEQGHRRDGRGRPLLLQRRKNRISKKGPPISEKERRREDRPCGPT